VPLVLEHPSLVSLADVPEADAPEQVLEDVAEGVLEAGTIQEEEEESADIGNADLRLVLEVP
jgi:hypothetical protein